MPEAIESGEFSVNEDGNEVVSFSSQAADDDTLWDDAKDELQQLDAIEICGECGDSLDDGEGYDGPCGSCADAAYGEEADEEEINRLAEVPTISK